MRTEVISVIFRFKTFGSRRRQLLGQSRDQLPECFQHWSRQQQAEL